MHVKYVYELALLCIFCITDDECIILVCMLCGYRPCLYSWILRQWVAWEFVYLNAHVSCISSYWCLFTVVACIFVYLMLIRCSIEWIFVCAWCCVELLSIFFYFFYFFSI